MGAPPVISCPRAAHRSQHSHTHTRVGMVNGHGRADASFRLLPSSMGGHSAWRKRVANGELAKKSGGAICRHRPHLGRKGKEREVERKGNIKGGPRKKKSNKAKRDTAADADAAKVSVSSTWPYLILLVRLVLAAVSQLVVAAAILCHQGRTSSHPLQAAAPYWIVYGTLIDVGTLLLLHKLLKNEDMRIVDVLGWRKDASPFFGGADAGSSGIRVSSGLLSSVGISFVIVLVMAVVGPIAEKLVYGSDSAPYPMVPLPTWASAYALVVWPIPWTVAEQMVYFGYALPRLQQRHTKTTSALLVSIGWGLQHCALPIVDVRWAIYRFIAPFCLGLVLSWLYLRTPPSVGCKGQRRLWPFVIAHWAADVLSVLMLVVLPETSNGP